LRIGLNPEKMRKTDSCESTFLSIVQVICGGIVGFFVYVIVKSKIILKLLYVGDVSTVTLDWDGPIALSLLAGLLANEIVRNVVRKA
jgi:ABC-type antimicrobial peptide transport system permease subunit